MIMRKYLPNPLIPEAPLAKQVALSTSIGEVAVLLSFSILAFNSRFPLGVHVML